MARTTMATAALARLDRSSTIIWHRDGSRARMVRNGCG
jgi:hypothetical protein